MHFTPPGIPAGLRTGPGRQGGAAPAAAAILPALLLAALPAAVAAGTGTGLAVAGESTALPPSFVWERVPGLAWRACGNARIEGGVLEVSLPEAGDGWAEADIDLSGYDGRAFEISATVAAEGVAGAGGAGLRVAVGYVDATAGGGGLSWPSAPCVRGDFGPADVVFTDWFEKERRGAVLRIGLQGTGGRARCDLSTVRIREPQPLAEPRNRDYVVEYPERIARMPLMRGAVVGGMGGRDDWETLQDWGAALVRHQMTVRGGPDVADFEGYARAFRANAAGTLDAMEKTLAAAAAHGMKVVLDAHFVPGGRCGPAQGDPVAWGEDCRIFHDRRFADLLVWFWERVAERAAGRRDAIYGYDLVNEASHHAPAIPGGDISGLQERIGRAIRAIDPDTPLVVESMHADPGWFRSLSPIGLGNVIYSVHLYYPFDYTHQGILTPAGEVFGWPDEARGWDRGFLRRTLAPVIDFQRRHGCRIYVGEFSAVSWAPGAEAYIGDCISLFEELGWDWTYHAFREFPGWSVEREPVSRGMRDEDFRPSADNPRMRVLKRGLRGELAPAARKGGPADEG